MLNDRRWQVPEEWRAGWQVAGVSMLGLAIAALPNYTLGIFMAPIEAEFGWSRAQISGGLLAIGLFSILFGPWVGMLIDRIGPRRVGIPGLIGFCIAIALLGTTSASLWHWWALWGLLAGFVIFIKVTLWASVISRRFTRHRGLALSVMMCGASIGSFIVPIVATWLIAQFGWRPAWAILGIGALIIALPLVLLYLDDGRGLRPEEKAAPADRLEGEGAISDALLSRRFIQLGLAAVLVVFGVAGVNVHLMPFLEGQGFARTTAAYIVGTVGIASMVGRLGTGVLLDRYHGAMIGAVAFGLPLLVVILLAFSQGSVPLAVAAAVCLGLAFGAEIDVLAYLASRYFGLRNYGTIFGVIAGLIAIGSSVGPVAAGAVYDWTRSYDLFFLVVGATSIAGSALIATLGAYPDSVAPASAS